MIRIKQEVKDLCIELRNVRDTDSKRFNEIRRILERKYGFTAYSLLALWENPPTIEYSNENVSLVMEE